MAVLLTDLPPALAAMGHRMPPSTSVVVAGRTLVEVDQHGPVRLGPNVSGVLLAVVVSALAEEGLVSLGTTIGECVARRVLPGDTDPDWTVASLLSAVADPAATPMSTCASSLLGRVAAAVSGQRLRRVVTETVTEPLGMTSTRWDRGWTSSATDLARLAGSEEWAAARERTGWMPEPGTARHGADDLAVAGLWRNDALDVSVGYCGDGRALLAVLDHLCA